MPLSEPALGFPDLGLRLTSDLDLRLRWISDLHTIEETKNVLNVLGFEPHFLFIKKGEKITTGTENVLRASQRRFVRVASDFLSNKKA